MKFNQNRPLLIRILLIGVVIAILIYLFHPAAGEFTIQLNGEPVISPLARFAAFPAFFVVLFFTAILMLFAFLGVGLLIFIGVLTFMMFGIFFIAPYSWPFLMVIFLIIVIMSFDKK